MSKIGFYQLLLFGLMVSLAYAIMMLIIGITSLNYDGHIGIKILSVLGILAVSGILYTLKVKKSLINGNLFYCILVIIGSALLILILYFAPTTKYISQPETVLYIVDCHVFIAFGVVVLLVYVWILIKVLSLKKKRNNLKVYIKKRLQSYAILDFLGQSLRIENYDLKKYDKAIGNYWNEVFTIDEGEYILYCDFLYIYTGLGRRGLCDYPINNIKINTHLSKGKQYRLRLSESEYVIEDVELYKINISIPIKININLQDKELSILLEEKL
ncbi:hypothetical protein O2K51_08010 [Apibacter raozihei]|uniref:hypothetical protein n=1 Tax=Apibacter raozihei TaxID=2500547 RepID=UPI000FE33055|nr:hypothetical protein [Apibacter raozihei]